MKYIKNSKKLTIKEKKNTLIPKKKSKKIENPESKAIFTKNKTKETKKTNANLTDPVDIHLIGKENYEVCKEKKKSYYFTLNKSNIDGNINKFYILQFLKQKSSEKYFIFKRWGRVGRLHWPTIFRRCSYFSTRNK